MGIGRSEFLDWSNVLDDMDGGDWAEFLARALAGQGHFTLWCRTGLDSRGGGIGPGQADGSRFVERMGRCRDADQGILTDLGLVLGQREMALAGRRLRVARHRFRLAPGAEPAQRRVAGGRESAASTNAQMGRLGSASGRARTSLVFEFFLQPRAPFQSVQCA